MRGGWRDMWLHPTVELAIGCVLLVLSAGFWLSANAGPIWSTRHWHWTAGAVLGSYFVVRAWKRRHHTP